MFCLLDVSVYKSKQIVMPHVAFVVKASSGRADTTQNTDDVAADDVNTLSGLLEAVAILMTGFQSALDKV